MMNPYELEKLAQQMKENVERQTRDSWQQIHCDEPVAVTSRRNVLSAIRTWLF